MFAKATSWLLSLVVVVCLLEVHESRADSDLTHNVPDGLSFDFVLGGAMLMGSGDGGERYAAGMFAGQSGWKVAPALELIARAHMAGSPRGGLIADGSFTLGGRVWFLTNSSGAQVISVTLGVGFAFLGKQPFRGSSMIDD